MRNLFILFLIFTFAIAVFPQKAKTNLIRSAESKIGDEKSDLEKAAKITKAAEKINALQKFIEKYPNSAEVNRAKELIISARAAIAEEKLKREDFTGAAELYKTAIKQAPTPMSDESFNGVLTFPKTLYLYGQIIPAYDVADLIRERAAGNRDRLLALATFYIQIENGVYAKKLAEQAIELDPNSAKAYQTLGLANRLIFFLEDAAAAYERAAELEGEQEASAKRDLANLKRGLGKPDEAIAIYRQILEKFPDDINSKTGLTLALFDIGKQTEAEAEMRKTLDIDSNNLTLLVGAAYWYAANNQPDKTISLAREAIVIEPRYVWSYIALSRALMAQKKSIEAEKVLLTARQYGNFPTLSYEIATVRVQAGFYREAANELNQNFDIKDGVLSTKLGGRVVAESDNFIELLQLERQSSIFQHTAADSSANAEKLKSLLAFSSAINSETADNAKISETADNFIKGDDKMKFHRQMFAATRLLETKKDVAKVKEIVKSAIPLLDSSLNIANPAAAVLADELYEPRNLAIENGELIIIPDVPKETLQTVLRGRIEEIAGWAEQQEANPESAVVHYKRGLSVLPKDSAMWHSTMWRMGEALHTQGKSKEALDAYIQSYQDTAPNAVRYLVIETLYKQINGSTDGLEKKVGKKPAFFDKMASIANSPVIIKTVSESENAGTDNNNLTETANPSDSDAEPETVEPEKPTDESTVVPIEKPSVVESQTEVKTPSETVIKNPPIIEIEETPIETVIETLPIVEIKETPTETILEVKPVTIEETPIESENTNEEVVADKNPVSENEQISKPPNENKAENTDVPKSAENTKPIETESSKSLFEPVIIDIPKTEKPKTANPNPKETTAEKPPETSNAGQTRLRVVSEDTMKKPTIESCKIIVTQENVSLINDGGNLGILVALENAPEDTEIKVVSSSPRDVRAVLEPGIGASSSNRSFFIISSISKNRGIYTVTFETACAKKEISVNVR